MLLIAIAVAGLAYWFRLTNLKYKNYEVTKMIPNTSESQANYISYGSAVIKYNIDGATAIDKDGKTLWTGTYEMMDPIADTCADYAVIADRGNKSIHIYNKKGEVGSIPTLYKIVKVEIARQGVVAVLMEEEDISYIKLYYADGTEITSSDETAALADMVKGVNDVGYPMDISLSEDGKKLAVVFLSVTTGKLVNSIGFYNFGEVGQNYEDNFVGGFSYPDVIVPRVTFLNNDVACAFKENGIVLFSAKELSNVLFEKDYDQKIKSVLHNEKYAGVVLEGTDGAANQLILYNLQGQKVLDKKINFDYDKIYLSGDEIIMHDNVTLLVLKTNGKEKFRYTFSSDIEAFYPMDGINRYILVNPTEMSEIKLAE
jgi:hypothetical protein